MKGTFTIVCLLIITSIVFSQEKVLDNAYLKCQYEYTLQSDTLSGKTRDDLLILQIGENISKCYSHYSNQIDSIDALPNGDNIIGKIPSSMICSFSFD